MASPVPPVDEFFEISPQVWRSDAVIGAERPSLEIGEDAMNPWQDNMRRHFANHLGMVVVAFEAAIG